MFHRELWLSACCLELALVLVPAKSGWPQSPETPAAAPPEVKGKPVQAALAEHTMQQLDLVYARYGTRELRLDLFRPNQATTPLPAVLVVHGGGWINGDKTRFRALAQGLAARGYVAAAIEYRLAGEARFPAAVQDVNAAVRWLRAHAAKYGIDPQRIAAVGGSAGGHLVGLAAAAPHVPEFQGDGGNTGDSSQLQAAVVMAGPFDLTSGPIAERSRTEPEQSNTNRWLGKTFDQSPELYRLASPLAHLSAQTPPVLFMHGEYDHPEQNLAARQRLRELGVATEITVYKSGRHGCWNQRPWFEPMLDDMDSFLSAVLKKTPASEPLRRIKADWGEIVFSQTGLDLQVSRRPDDGVIRIPRLNNPVASVELIAGETKAPLVLSPGLSDWAIASPKSATNAATASIRVETIGRPCLPEIPRIVSAAADGTITLAAHDAVTHGQALRYEPQPHKNTLGYWSRKEDWCEWHFYTEQPGKLELHILQGCGKGQGGSEVQVSLGDQKVAFTVEDTGHFQNFKDRAIGTLTLATPGLYSLQIRPITKAAAAVMDVRQVRLLLATEVPDRSKDSR